MVLFLHLLLKFARKMFILHFFVATLVQKWHFSMKSTEKSLMGGSILQNWPSHETCIIIITTGMNLSKTNTVHSRFLTWFWDMVGTWSGHSWDMVYKTKVVDYGSRANYELNIKNTSHTRPTDIELYYIWNLSNYPSEH